MFDHMVIPSSAWHNLICIQSIAVTITVSNAKNVVDVLPARPSVAVEMADRLK